MGIQPLGTSPGSLLKLLLFPSFCTSSRKIPFVSIVYMIFFLFHTRIYSPRARVDNPLGQFFMEAESLCVCVEVLRPSQQLRSCRTGQLPIKTVPWQD